MEFIKKHWVKLSGGLVVLIILLLAFVAIKELVFPDDRKSLYGNRLEGIEDVQIKAEKFSALATKLKGNSKVKSVNHNINGRIINLVVDVEKDTDLITAKALGDEIIKAFSTAELEFYDLQFFLTCNADSESELYPTIGYKHKTSLTFKWNGD